MESTVTVEPQQRAATLSADSKPLVFISHDSRDAEIAEAFANLLSDVSGGTLKSFRSSDKKGTSGIEFGAEWYKAIMEKIGSATDVVALLTQHSIDRPWILYEAGVASGTLRVQVTGVAIGVPLEKASAGPFAQFMNSDDEEDSLTKLVMQLVQRNPSASPREEAVRRQVRAFKEAVAALLKRRGEKAATTSQPKVDENAVAKLFEEVKVLFRDLPEQVESKLHRQARRGPLSMRLRMMHPMMFEELLFRDASGEGEVASTSWLLFISLLRDDFPWLFELGMEVYRAMRADDPRLVRTATRDLQHVLRRMIKSPLGDELFAGEGRHGGPFLRHELMPMIEHFLDRIGRSKRVRKKEAEESATLDHSTEPSEGVSQPPKAAKPV